MATITEKSLIGPQGKVLVDGLQWHDTATEITWDYEFVAAADYPISHVDTKMTHIDKRVSMNMEARHVLGDNISKEVIDNWGGSSLALSDVIISAAGMRVGDSCEVHRVLPSGKDTQLLRDDLTKSSLSAESSGLSFSGDITSGMLGDNVYVLTSDFATGTFQGLVRKTYSSSSESEVTINLQNSNNSDATKNKMVLFVVWKGVSGLSHLTSDSTAQIVAYQDPALAEDHADYVATVELTEAEDFTTDYHKTAVVIDTPPSGLNKIGLKLNLGDLPTGNDENGDPWPTNYNVELRVAVSLFYATAVDVS